MSGQITGIACIYGITISFGELLYLMDTPDCEEDPEDFVRKSLPGGLDLYTHPDWDSDLVLIGTTIVSLDLDPSPEGSKLAPVVNIPDIIDFSRFSDNQPRYYQIPTY